MNLKQAHFYDLKGQASHLRQIRTKQRYEGAQVSTSHHTVSPSATLSSGPVGGWTSDIDWIFLSEASNAKKI